MEIKLENISETFVKELCKEPNIKEAFIREGIIEEVKYTEKEVLKFTQTIIMQYKFGNTNIEQIDLLKETLEQFKKK